MSVEDAARAAGVKINTVRGWLRDGRKDPDGRFGRFAADLDAVRAEAPTVRAGALDLEELRELVAKAARGGSVPAMRLALDMLRGAEQPSAAAADSLAAIDELAAVRQRKRGAA